MPDTPKPLVDKLTEEVEDAKKTIARLEGMARLHGVPENEILAAKQNKGRYEALGDEHATTELFIRSNDG